ncbi:unnamed protein product, partial [marine sediment metagenome]
YKYIFLLVYLIAVLFAVKKLMPKGTEAIWDLGKRARLGGVVAGMVGGSAAAKGAWKMAKAPAAAVKAGRQAFGIHKGLGHGWKRSAGAAMERGWAATKLQTTGELRPKAMVKSVAKGTWEAVKDSASAGWKAATIKKKAKAKKDIKKGEEIETES